MWNAKLPEGKPLYLAILDALQKDIRNGTLSPGDRLPPHRKLALQLGVHVSTASRAYREAEKRGLLQATVGSGTYIATAKNNAEHSGAERSGRIELGRVLPLCCVERQLQAPIEELIREVTLQSDLQILMQQCEPSGLYQHRQTAAAWVRQFGVNAQPESMVITCGLQHSINCALAVACKPGTRLAVDNFTLPGLRAVAQNHGIILEGVPMDKEGMLPEHLDMLCRDYSIKGVFTSATNQNPTNACMSLQRKKLLAEVIRQHSLILIEAGHYSPFMQAKGAPQKALPAKGLLAASPTPAAESALAAFVPEQSIYLADRTNAFLAGLRVGFIAAANHLCEPIARAVLESVRMAPPLSVAIACACIRSGLAKKILTKKATEFTKRFALFKEAIKALDNSLQYEYQPESAFIWLHLPEGWSGERFEKNCAEQGLSVAGAEYFAVGDTATLNKVRISLSGAVDRKEFAQGVARLVKVLQRGPEARQGIL